jgi:hypothetical protein
MLASHSCTPFYRAAKHITPTGITTTMFTKTDIEKYFIAEKQESLLYMALGLAAILLALAGLFIWKTNCWKGASFPLIAIACIQIIVGYTVYARSDVQRQQNVYAFDMNPMQLVQEELPRMQTVNRNFIIYRYIEIGLLLAGITLAGLFYNNPERQLYYGLGIALALQAAIMLGADYFAEKRANIYTAQLKTVLYKTK